MRDHGRSRNGAAREGCNEPESAPLRLRSNAVRAIVSGNAGDARAMLVMVGSMLLDAYHDNGMRKADAPGAMGNSAAISRWLLPERR